ncbi:MAG TPA: hypothetical protein VHB47_22055, partial [Thermoanaerobaculia bacterium]|nr:hypothetical protein [Thermoanaerobaculia bacterium]
ALLFLPHLHWQAAAGWPTLEFMANAAAQRMARVPPLVFLARQLFYFNPAAAVLSIAGFWFLLADSCGRRYRVIGLALLIVFCFLMAGQKSKVTYLVPAYTMLFAAGAVALAQRFERRGRCWLPAVLLLAVVGVGAALAPLRLPILSIEGFRSYQRLLGVPPASEENLKLGTLPQRYADMFGWRELTAAVARAAATLPPRERAAAPVFTFNYGEAAALDFFGREAGAPRAISGHNSYWRWGPGPFSGEVLLAIGGEREEWQQQFEEVAQVGATRCADCMPYENGRPIFVLRHLRRPLRQAWLEWKHYD